MAKGRERNEMFPTLPNADPAAGPDPSLVGNPQFQQQENYSPDHPYFPFAGAAAPSAAGQNSGSRRGNRWGSRRTHSRHSSRCEHGHLCRPLPSSGRPATGTGRLSVSSLSPPMCVPQVSYLCGLGSVRRARFLRCFFHVRVSKKEIAHVCDSTATVGSMM